MSLSIDDDAGALGNLLAHVPDFVLLIDRKGRLRYINRVEPGFDRRNVIGAPASMFVFRESQDAFEAALSIVLATGETRELEVETPLPDGASRWYQSRIFPFRKGESIVGAVIVAADVTELKRAQDSLRKMRTLLPICAWCGRIRNDGGGWDTLEEYLAGNVGTRVTHAMCSDCYKEQGGTGSPP